MSVFELGPGNGLFYELAPPADEASNTFVFFNPLTGDHKGWEAVVAPSVRAQGFGTLSFNFRGQTDSPFTQETALTPDLIVDDARRLLADLNPVNPIFVGLSIGGLFAADLYLSGVGADGLVLINTLRRDGPRLKWINDALVRAVEVGGLDLFRDLYVPLLFGEDWQAENRRNFLKAGAYVPLDPASGHANLLRHAGAADWDISYEQLDLPVLVLSGLQDRVFYDRADVDVLAARIPDARQVDWQDVGHLLPAEAPERLAGLLADFAGGL